MSSKVIITLLFSHEQAVVERFPRLLKSAASLGTECLGRRFISTDAAESLEEVAKAAAGAASAKPTNNGNSTTQTTPSSDKKGGRRGNRYSKAANVATKNNTVAAATVAESQDNRKRESSNIKRVTTRLVDNHPLTEEDRDPHYYLSHLTEDQLDPDIPVFEEERKEFPDLYSETREVVTTDIYGHKLIKREHIPSKREQDMNNLGFVFRTDDMYGVNFLTPPVIGNAPSVSDNGVEGTRSREDQEDRGTFEALERDGDLLEGTPLKPGTDKQMKLDYESHVRHTLAISSRRQRRQLELGYDHRDTSNSQPWVNTHRIEAIDARLRDLHEQRDSGILEYPLEQDAAMEAQRIRAEEKEAIDTIRKAIGVKGDEPLGDSYLFQQDDKKPDVQTRGRYVNRRLVHKPVVIQPTKNDPELDTMDVYSIPVEKLYQARRQELERIRATNYEDFDLSYLLQQSGKQMDRRDGARSLYEKRHGRSEKNRLPTEEEKENPILGAKYLPKYLTAEEKAELGQKLVAYEKYSNLNPDDAMRLYAPYLQILTPEMVEAEKKMKEEQNQEKEDASSNSTLFEKPADYNPPSTEESAENASESNVSDIYVDPGMDQIQRDPNKPLQDYEVGLNENGDLMLAWRKNRPTPPDYLKDKDMFMKGVENVYKTTKLSEEEEKEARDMKMEKEDIEEMRRNVGLPDDLSEKTFYKRYLRGLRRSKDDGSLVSEVMTGYSLDRSDEMLKVLGLDTEDGVEEYLMDTFKSHQTSDDLLMPPEQRDAIKVLQKASKAIKEAKEMIAKKKEEEAAGSGTEGKEGEASSATETEKKEGEAPVEGKKESEAPVEGKEGETPMEGKKEAETPTVEEAKEGEVPSAKDATEAAEEKTEETESSTEEDIEHNPYEGMSLSEAYERLHDRFDAAREEANKMVPTKANSVIGSGHIVDALEYSDQVYVHEKDRELIFRMYKQGIHPKEISKTFGFHESRIYAILRLMKAREAYKKEGTYSDKVVKTFEENENVFAYDYRDMPPAEYKNVDRRREAKIPSAIPRFVFLEEGDEEAKVMREIDQLIRRRRQEESPTLERRGLPVGHSRKMMKC